MTVWSPEVLGQFRRRETLIIWKLKEKMSLLALNCNTIAPFTSGERAVPLSWSPCDSPAEFTCLVRHVVVAYCDETDWCYKLWLRAA